MTKNIEKIKLCIFFLISAVGFTSGINFMFNLNGIDSIKKCFEFGMYEFFQGQNYYIVFMTLLFSVLKHYIFMFICHIFWISFPFVPLNLFGLSFKMGVVASSVIKTLGFQGFFECVFVILIVIAVLFSASIFSYFLFNRRLYHSRYNKIDYTDIIFLKKSLIYAFVFCFFITIIYLFSNVFELNLHGFINTFL